jgi:phosphopantothenoylcysteine decarboxylase/phosphopantothenate--cysteine ligase
MTNSALKDKNIILAVTGSISCYKSVDLASKLMQLGANVYVILSGPAQQFVSALTFTSITHLPVVTEMFNANSKFSVEHVALAEMADIVIISPATANTIAKLAHGLSDDSLGTTVLATKAPVIVAPAMDANMYENPVVQSNIRILEELGYSMAGPDYGRMASGLEGWGRLLETQDLISYINLKLGENGDLKGCKVVVSAGGTSEPIDPVRVISNRSSGKMGYSIAIAALERGATVSLVSASKLLPDPLGCKVLRVETVSEMRDCVLSECNDADAVIMAAAISDYRVKDIADNKIKKQPGKDMVIELIQNEDFLKEIPEKVKKIGFAAETENLEQNAIKKLNNKDLEFIIANDVTVEGAGFSVDTNKVTIIDKSGTISDYPLQSKYEVANIILDKLSQILNS